MPEEDGGLIGVIQGPRRPVRTANVGSRVGGYIARKTRGYWDQGQREGYSDAALIRNTPPEGSPHNEMEMQRRLKGAVEELTRELVSFREGASKDSQRQIEMSEQLSDAVESLTREVITSRVSSDKLAGRLLRANYLLVALTVVLVALTVVLAILAVKS